MNDTLPGEWTKLPGHLRWYHKLPVQDKFCLDFVLHSASHHTSVHVEPLHPCHTARHPPGVPSLTQLLACVRLHHHLPNATGTSHGIFGEYLCSDETHERHCQTDARGWYLRFFLLPPQNSLLELFSWTLFEKVSHWYAYKLKSLLVLNMSILLFSRFFFFLYQLAYCNYLLYEYYVEDSKV